SACYRSVLFLISDREDCVRLQPQGASLTVFRITTPSDEALEDSANWQKLGNQTYAAVQAHILVIQERATKAAKGSPVKTIDIPAGAEYVIQNKTARVTKFAGEIQRTVQNTLTSKYSAEIASKLAAETSFAGPVPSGKLSSEFQSKVGTELT